MAENTWVSLVLFHPEINGVIWAPTEITGFLGPPCSSYTGVTGVISPRNTLPKTNSSPLEMVVSKLGISRIPGAKLLLVSGGFPMELLEFIKCPR